MIIKTLGNDYLVIGNKGWEGKAEVCLCENMADRRRCLMLRIKDGDLIRASVGFLYEQADNRSFTDFEECTTDADSLLLVFPAPQGQPLKEKLEGEYASLKERAQIVKNALEKIILQDMAPYFATVCLRPEAVWVRRNLDASFRYSVADVEWGRDYAMGEVQESLLELLETVFEEELEKETLPPMAAFLKRLEQEELPDYMELYRQFGEAAEEMLALPKEELEVPKTWIFRLWDRIRRLFKPLKTLLLLAVLLATLMYMIWTLQTASQPAASMELMDRIGTLEILHEE